MEDPGTTERPSSAVDPDSPAVESESGRLRPPPVGTEEISPGSSLAEDEGRRPTPVRVVMKGAAEETSDEPGDQRMLPDPEGGEGWLVSVGGRSVAGVLPLRTVSLLELNFARIGEPQLPVRRVLCPGEDLEGLSEERVLEAFLASELYRPPLQEESGLDQPDRRGSRRIGSKG